MGEGTKKDSNAIAATLGPVKYEMIGRKQGFFHWMGCKNEKSVTTFYENFVTIRWKKKCCCLSPTYHVDLLPRFKIVDASTGQGEFNSCTLCGALVWFIAGLTLFTVGVGKLGNDAGEQDGQVLVGVLFGALFLFVIAPAVFLLQNCSSDYYVNLETKAPMEVKSWFFQKGCQCRYWLLSMVAIIAGLALMTSSGGGSTTFEYEVEGEGQYDNLGEDNEEGDGYATLMMVIGFILLFLMSPSYCLLACTSCCSLIRISKHDEYLVADNLYRGISDNRPNEAFIFQYVYGPIDTVGTDTQRWLHMCSHLNQAELVEPAQPRPTRVPDMFGGAPARTFPTKSPEICYEA